MRYMKLPKVVRTALFFLCLSLSLGVIRSSLDLIAHPEKQPPNIPLFASIMGVVSVAAIGFILIFHISKARNWARVVFTLLVALSCIGLPFTLKNLAQTGVVNPIAEALGLAQVLIQVAGIGLLYRPEARQWFRGEMTQVPVDSN